MTSSIRLVTFAVALAGTAFAMTATAQEVARRAPTAGPVACADPAAVGLKVEAVVSQTQGEMSTYTFRLIGTVQNIGTSEFKAAGGLTATLTFGSKRLGLLDVPALAAGATAEVRGQMSAWSAEEDPGDFALALSTDSADCRADDNRLVVASPEMERALRGK
ncbi:MAG: hypothetical protein U1E56_03190 [Bauldia sp.]